MGTSVIFVFTASEVLTVLRRSTSSTMPWTLFSVSTRTTTAPTGRPPSGTSLVPKIESVAEPPRLCSSGVGPLEGWEAPGGWPPVFVLGRPSASVSWVSTCCTRMWWTMMALNMLRMIATTATIALSRTTSL